MVFIDFIKAFDSYSCEGVGQLLIKAGRPSKVGACVVGLKGKSHAFLVSNRTKQGCVVGPLQFGIFFSTVFQDAFKDGSEGVMKRFRIHSVIFNLQHVKAQTKVSSLLV